VLDRIDYNVNRAKESTVLANKELIKTLEGEISPRAKAC